MKVVRTIYMSNDTTSFPSRRCCLVHLTASSDLLVRVITSSRELEISFVPSKHQLSLLLFLEGYGNVIFTKIFNISLSLLGVPSLLLFCFSSGCKTPTFYFFIDHVLNAWWSVHKDLGERGWREKKKWGSEMESMRRLCHFSSFSIPRRIAVTCQFFREINFTGLLHVHRYGGKLKRDKFKSDTGIPVLSLRRHPNSHPASFPLWWESFTKLRFRTGSDDTIPQLSNTSPLGNSLSLSLQLAKSFLLTVLDFYSSISIFQQIFFSGKWKAWNLKNSGQDDELFVSYWKQRRLEIHATLCHATDVVGCRLSLSFRWISISLHRYMSLASFLYDTNSLSIPSSFIL